MTYFAREFFPERNVGNLPESLFLLRAIVALIERHRVTGGSSTRQKDLSLYRDVQEVLTSPYLHSLPDGILADVMEYMTEKNPLDLDVSAASETAFLGWNQHLDASTVRALSQHFGGESVRQIARRSDAEIKMAQNVGHMKVARFREWVHRLTLLYNEDPIRSSSPVGSVIRTHDGTYRIVVDDRIVELEPEDEQALQGMFSQDA